MRLVLLSMFALLPACASQTPAAAPPRASESAPAAASSAAPARSAVELAASPYTAAQIRDASPAGRRLVFKVQEPGKPDVKRVIEFVKSDANGADLRVSATDSAGNVLENTASHATWEELRSHADFPKDRTEVRHRTISIPIGTLDCIVYKVTDGEGPSAEVTTYYFAKSMPGPPVFFFVEKGGTRVRASTMESSTGAK